MAVLVRVIVIALLAHAGMSVPMAAAIEKPANAEATRLPQPLTPETVRDLVSRLSYEQVRRLLIEQLDRSSARPAGKDEAGMGMLGMMADNAGMWRSRVAQIGAATLTLPATTTSVFAKLSEGARPSVLLIVIAAMLAAGALS